MLMVGILLLQSCEPLRSPFAKEPVHLWSIWPEKEANLVGVTTDSEGTIFAIDDDGYLYAVKPPAEIIWKYKGNYVSASNLGISETFIYFIADDQKIFAVNKDGSEKWVVDVGSKIITSPLVAPDSSVYLQTLNPEKELEYKIHHIFLDGTRTSFTLPFLSYLENSAIDANGNLFFWRRENFTLLSPTGEILRECINDEKGKLGSNLISIPEDGVAYALSDGRVVARKTDCTLLWQFTTETNERTSANYHLYYNDQTIYIGSPTGTLGALQVNNGEPLWMFESGSKEEPSVWEDTPVMGSEVVSIISLNDNLTYVLNARGMVTAIDRQGTQTWMTETYEPGKSVSLYSLPGDDLLIFHGGLFLLYTHNFLHRYAGKEGVPHAANKRQAENEIIDFALNFIIGDEIIETADFIIAHGEPWIDAPPSANIIIYSTVLGMTDGHLHVDADTPIRVWWQTEDHLIEVDEKLKAIEEYQSIYMTRDYPSIFTWGYYEIGIAEINPDYRSAVIYIGVSCGRLCGHGVIYTIRRSASGKWWIFSQQTRWKS
jgi:outer membrane protein assembly factor BamB